MRIGKVWWFLLCGEVIQRKKEAPAQLKNKFSNLWNDSPTLCLISGFYDIACFNSAFIGVFYETRKRPGPRTVPYDTPEPTSSSDSTPPILILCFLFNDKFSTQLHISSLISFALSSASSLLGGTLLKGLLKSRWFTSIGFQWSFPSVTRLIRLVAQDLLGMNPCCVSLIRLLVI